MVIERRPLQQHLLRGLKELYDIENDRDDIENLVEKPECAEVLTEVLS